MKKTDKVQAFWDRVEAAEDGCWLWQGPKNAGYGRFSDGYRQRPAHCIAYELIIGPIPEGQQADHLCRVRNCVNPKHIDITSPSTNLKRSWIARRSRRGFCVLCSTPMVEPNVLMGTDGILVCRRCGCFDVTFQSLGLKENWMIDEPVSMARGAIEFQKNVIIEMDKELNESGNLFDRLLSEWAGTPEQDRPAHKLEIRRAAKRLGTAEHNRRGREVYVTQAEKCLETVLVKLAEHQQLNTA